jgi:hypothetical protein
VLISSVSSLTVKCWRRSCGEALVVSSRGRTGVIVRWCSIIAPPPRQHRRADRASRDVDRDVVVVVDD